MSAGAVRDFLSRHGLAANRDLGQNFLVDAALAERLVGLAGVEPGDAVIEIGTGLGILTRALAARARHVTSIEIDGGLVRALRAESVLPDDVELLHADALDVDLGALARAAGAPVRLVANLPYSVSAPLLRRLLDLRGDLVDWSVMIQRDVADRLLATPGTKDYGSLAVLHALTVEVTRTSQLGPRCFYPVPRVHSSFVRISPREKPGVAGGELAWVERVVRAAFAQRRKTIANSLRGSGLQLPPQPALELALERAGIEPRARAESLAPERLVALARALPSGDERGEA